MNIKKLRILNLKEYHKTAEYKEFNKKTKKTIRTMWN